MTTNNTKRPHTTTVANTACTDCTYYARERAYRARDNAWERSKTDLPSWEAEDAHESAKAWEETDVDDIVFTSQGKPVLPSHVGGGLVCEEHEQVRLLNPEWSNPIEVASEVLSQDQRHALLEAAPGGYSRALHSPCKRRGRS